MSKCRRRKKHSRIYEIKYRASLTQSQYLFNVRTVDAEKSAGASGQAAIKQNHGHGDETGGGVKFDERRGNKVMIGAAGRRDIRSILSVHSVCSRYRFSASIRNCIRTSRRRYTKLRGLW